MFNRMKKKTWLPAVLLGSALFFFSCQKEINDDISGNPTNPTTLDLTTKVTTAKISGYVTDENNLPVEGAQVQAGTAFSTTDAYGYFQFRNTEVV
ncbi:MAG TPA: carboxypeptidase-like regulatory domain-containing protein, partial [Ferruginibacter sp.]|nr:carboxypeptidase-like regulatory domain-containing protein [Ferruginibacter sp.]